jgi:hypothetical protein
MRTVVVRLHRYIVRPVDVGKPCVMLRL